MKKISENSLFSDISTIVISILITICTIVLFVFCILIIKSYSIVIPFGKAPDAISADLFSTITLVKLLQSKNAPNPIVVTLLGILSSPVKLFEKTT